MTTISDQSTIAPFPWWLWLLAAAFLVAVATIRAIHRAPLMPAEPSRLDTLDGVGVATCHLRCHRPGTVTRVTREDLGLETVRVCPGHSDEGDVKAWWVA
ncbi:MAG: hypothetical protein M3P04_00435 [Actinomycetota bacterium]|nr:hypothetical protein [Actinomycetota bacterium]